MMSHYFLCRSYPLLLYGVVFVVACCIALTPALLPSSFSEVEVGDKGQPRLVSIDLLLTITAHVDV